jgi:hypothetical protein
MVLIVGILSLGGYSREYPLEMPADGKGAKGGGVMSRTHATGSAITYGKRYLKNMIFDLRFKEKDDDGNKAGGNSGEMPDETLQGWLDSMRQASTHEELRKLYGDAYRAAEKLGDRDAMDSIIRVKDAVKKGLK